MATLDGSPLAAGKTVRVEATVRAFRTFSADRLDLYRAANANSPAWTLIATLTPTVAGAQTLSASYPLPAGPLQAVRARFRYQGSASPCASGSSPTTTTCCSPCSEPCSILEQGVAVWSAPFQDATPRSGVETLTTRSRCSLAPGELSGHETCQLLVFVFPERSKAMSYSKTGALWFFVPAIATAVATASTDATAFFLRTSAASCFVNTRDSDRGGRGPHFDHTSEHGIFLSGSFDTGRAFCAYPETDATLKSSLTTVNIHGSGALTAQACIAFWNASGGFCSSPVSGQNHVLLGAPSAWQDPFDGHFPYVVVRSTSGSLATLKGLFFAD